MTKRYKCRSRALMVNEGDGEGLRELKPVKRRSAAIREMRVLRAIEKGRNRRAKRRQAKHGDE